MWTTVKSLGKGRSSPYEGLSDDEARIGDIGEELRAVNKTSRRSNLPDDIPRGYLAVYVGKERKRFVVSTKSLNHQVFKELLKRVLPHSSYYKRTPPFRRI